MTDLKSTPLKHKQSSTTSAQQSANRSLTSSAQASGRTPQGSNRTPQVSNQTPHASGTISQGTGTVPLRKSRHAINSEMARETDLEIVGPMPIGAFMEAFFPRYKRGAEYRTRWSRAHFNQVPTLAPKAQVEAWLKTQVKDYNSPKSIDDDDDDKDVDGWGVQGEGMEGEEKPAGEEGTVDETGVGQDNHVSIPEGNELDMYGPMTEALAAILTDYDVLNTAYHPDRNSNVNKKTHADIGCYKQGELSSQEKSEITTSEPLDTPPTQLDKVDLAVELKSYMNRLVYNDHKSEGPFLCDTQHAKETRGQMATFLAEVSNRQHRTCTYMLFIGDPEARIIRADRAGIIVTKAINIRTDPRPLLEFLRHFNECNHVERGLDSSVRVATAQEAELAKAKLSEKWAPLKERPVYAIKVPGGPGLSHETREVLAWGTVRDADSLTGRCTRAYPVYSERDRRVVFLKDTWRTDAENMLKESDLIRELKKDGKVPHIPNVLAGDDVLDQCTKTQDYQKCSWNKAGTDELDPRIHHRLLEDFIPTFLGDYKSPRGLLKAITDALIAHEAAFKYGVLHRDISDHNILITEDGEGILTDWELALRIRTTEGEPIETQSRQRYRTGTWAFISARLLQGSAKRHQLSDDLESFFWLVLYIALRTLVIEREDAMELETLIRELFYESNYMRASGTSIGGEYKVNLLLGSNLLRGLRFPGNEALTTWYNVLTPVLENVYVRTARQRDDLTAQLRDHTFVLKVFQAALASSEWSDERPAFEVGAVIKTQTRRKRRVANARPDDDYMPPNAKKLKSTEGGRNKSTPAGSSTQGGTL